MALEGRMVPIVGLPMRLGPADVLATLVCACQVDNPPLMLKSVNEVVACPTCESRFAIMSVAFNRQKLQPLQVEIAFLGKG